MSDASVTDRQPAERARAEETTPLATPRAPAQSKPGPEPESGVEAAARSGARKRWLVRLMVAVVVVALVWGGWYLLVGRTRVTTDDAYVGADMAQVTPLVSAAVVAVHVSDAQPVRRGDVLVELDPTDAKIAVAQARADLADARRKFRQTLATGRGLAAQLSARQADIAAEQQQIVSAKAAADAARVTLARTRALAPSGAASADELTVALRTAQQADAALAAARATLTQTRATAGSAGGQFAANQALTRGFTEATDPGVQAAAAKLAAAELDLTRMVIRAPIDGVISQRKVQVGQRVSQGVPILDIVPVSQVYVDANFKERQLREVRVGMPARITSDLYGGGVVFHGHVAGIAGATGAATALIPAQNATGNWIKVVQRLPVRIVFDHPQELADHPLRVGLSTNVAIELDGH